MDKAATAIQAATGGCLELARLNNVIKSVTIALSMSAEFRTWATHLLGLSIAADRASRSALRGR